MSDLGDLVARRSTAGRTHVHVSGGTVSEPTLQPADVQTRADMGRALTALRHHRALTVRQLAARCALPVATVSDWTTGTHLPGPSQWDTFQRLLDTLGVAGDAMDAWRSALTRARRRAKAPLKVVPYPGLASFEPETAQLFFGRDDVIEELLARLNDFDAAAVTGTGRTPIEPERLPRLLIVIGASGSGKSSVLRAGVMPRVADGALGERSAAVITPDTAPLDTLAAAGTPRLLVIDQFEELFTRHPAETRAEFLSLVAALPATTLVVVALRADFWAAAAEDDDLLAVLASGRQLILSAMSGPQLRQAIEQPAIAAGAEIDPDLTTQIITDTLGQGSRLSISALPLMAHALLVCWQRHTGGRVTLADYEAVGGVGGSVEQTAEQTYASLDDDDRIVIRRVFLRLVTVEADGTATRRQASRSELLGLGHSVEIVIERFVSSRLLTVDRDTVEISHEALLTAWSRLQSWTRQDVAGRREHQALSAATAAWQDSGGEDDSLLVGGRLARAEDWAADADRAATMSPTERDFLSRSTQARDAIHRREARRTRTLLSLVVTLTVLVVVVAGLAAVALSARSRALRDEHAVAEQQRVAASRAAAASAGQISAKDDALGQQLALAAYRLNPNTATRSALLDSLSAGPLYRLTGPSGPTAVAVDRAGALLARSNAATGGVDLYRLSNGFPTSRLGTVAPAAAEQQVFALSFDPDGRRLAIGGADQRVRLVDVSDPAHPVAHTLPGTFGGSIQAVAFSPSGTMLAAGAVSPSVRVWRLSGTSASRSSTPTDASSEIANAVAFSPDGLHFSAGGQDKTMRTWTTDGLDRHPKTTPVGRWVNTMTYSPTGVLAIGDRRHVLTILSHSGAILSSRALPGFTAYLNVLSWSPSGDKILAAGADGALAVLDRTGTPMHMLPAADPITAALYTHDGRHIVTAGADGTVRVRSATTSLPAADRVFTVSWPSSSESLATIYDSGARIWSVAPDTTPAAGLAPIQPPAFGVTSGAGALSPNGRLLALGGAAHSVLLTDTAAGTNTVLTGPTQTVESVAFTQDSHVMVAACDDGFLYRWDLTDTARPVTLARLKVGSLPYSVAITGDGSLIAAASLDHTAHLWRVDRSGAVSQLPSLTGFTNYTTSVAFSPDAHLVAVGGADATVRIWDVSRRQPVLLAGPLRGPTQYIWSVAFSPDDKQVSASGGDGTVWNWLLDNNGHATLESTLRAAGSLGAAFTIAYSPHGHRLAAGSAGAAVTFWPTDADIAAQELCNIGGSHLSRAEWSQYVPDAPYRETCAKR